MDARARLATLTDPELPSLSLMLGDGAATMLGSAPDLVGGAVLSARPAQILWSPGRQLVVRYAANVETAGTVTDRMVVAATGSAIPRTLRDGDPAQVLAWTGAADPHLPGLASATDPTAVGRMLETLGLDSDPVRLGLRAYRPTRRAVVQVVHPAATLYLKVVRPGAIARLDALHRLDPGVRTPRSLGWSRDLGIVVLEALPGCTLRDTLADATAPLPPPASLLGALDGLVAPPDALQAAGPTATLRRHTGLLRAVVPECADLIDRVAEASVPEPDAPQVPIHGDFYETQVLVADGSVTGLIDLDRMALGHRVDDVATMAAHLAAWAPSSPEPDRVLSYGGSLLATAAPDIDLGRLRVAVAVALVGLATGPFRAQSPDWPRLTARRLEAATTWLADPADLPTLPRIDHTA